jgi:two-component system nitrogen regulation response regulator GlnG
VDSIATLRPAAGPTPDVGGGDSGVTLTIVAHPDPARVGEMAAIEFGAPRRVALSRREPLFAAAGAVGRPLEDLHLSRSPVHLSFATGDFPVWSEPTDASSQIRALHGTASRAWFVTLAGRIGLLVEPVLRPSAPRERHGLLGVSVGIEQLREHIDVAATSELSALLCGETGTGKELVATAIHAASPRRQRPLVTVNLSAIPESTAASQLFGHARGAFTDAARAHDGYFVQADGGSLFLDEIGEAQVSMQVQLLRALEQREIQPIGGRVRTVDVRVIAATDADLTAAVGAGRFRRALLFRLQGLVVPLLPLRERPADIAVQLVHFLAQALQALGRADRLCMRSWQESPWLDLPTVEAALTHRWAGNSRELRATASQAALLGVNKPQVTLTTRATMPSPHPSPPPSPPPVEPGVRLTEVAVREALATHGYAVRSAARALQIAPNTLYARMDELGIPRAGELSNSALASARALAGDDLEAMARQLGVSLHGLKRRLGRSG